MKLPAILLFAVVPVLAAGCQLAIGLPAVWGNVAVLLAAIGIFVATLSLGRSSPSGETTDSGTATRP